MPKQGFLENVTVAENGLSLLYAYLLTVQSHLYFDFPQSSKHSTWELTILHIVTFDISSVLQLTCNPFLNIPCRLKSPSPEISFAQSLIPTANEIGFILKLKT